MFSGSPLLSVRWEIGLISCCDSTRHRWFTHRVVLHFAAYAYVGESMTDPSKYYRNNVGDSLALLEALKAEGERRGTSPLPLVFSSTCATYGIPAEDQIPIAETCPQQPINPYGRSKWMVSR